MYELLNILMVLFFIFIFIVFLFVLVIEIMTIKKIKYLNEQFRLDNELKRRELQDKYNDYESNDLELVK